MNHKIYIATCPEETKPVLAEELCKLGAESITPLYKAIKFQASNELIYKSHLQLRTASRLLQILKQVRVTDAAGITRVCQQLRWEKFFKPGATYLVDGVNAERWQKTLTSNEISKSVRLGIEAYFRKIGKEKPAVNLQEPDLVVVAHLSEGQLTLSLDTTGKVLHKRGYRVEGHPAPLKETLAASLLMFAGYDGSLPFLDPMCGSGTIAIEATYIALHKAPLIHRKKGQFGLEHLPEFDSQLWRKIQDDLRRERIDAPPQGIFACDISESYVEGARQNALRARVEKHITFLKSSFFELSPPADQGLIVTNLPYGERIDGSSRSSLEEFYSEVGKVLKHNFQGWSAGLLVAEDAPIKAIGLKPKRKIPILNGSIRCKFLLYDLFHGKRKDHLSLNS